MPLTVGTAGHIDHGKTALVEALTGKNTDRLPEEHERGISIDLGYAPLKLPDGSSPSVGDPPAKAAGGAEPLCGRRPRPRALRPHHGGGRERHRSLPARDRRRRGSASADTRAYRDPAAPRDRPR